MILTGFQINEVKVNCRLLVLILRNFCSLSEKLKERVNIIKVCFRKLMISLYGHMVKDQGQIVGHKTY